MDNKEEKFPMRINKYLALKKYTTRRGADLMIEKKQILINGRIAVLGDKVNEDDKVEVKHKASNEPRVYIAYNKPRNILTHSAKGEDEEIRDVSGLKDVFPIGRLDKDSEGLMILTNDGRITERLLSPRFNHEKEYLVTVKEKLRGSFKTKMEAGVKIENEMTKPCKVHILNEQTFKVVLTEGKKHQIRRMCVALFQEVDTLKRIRIMNIQLGSLKSGGHRKIEGDELHAFLHELALA